MSHGEVGVSGANADLGLVRGRGMVSLKSLKLPTGLRSSLEYKGLPSFCKFSIVK